MIDFKVLDVKASNATGAAQDLNDQALNQVSPRFVQVGGTFSATIDVQSTIETATSSSGWVTIQSITGPAFIAVPVGNQVRLVTRSYVSGTPLAWVF